jgi:glycosyltransferase involved in cell wall biosynthesis
MPHKMLIVTTIAGTIEDFLLPFVRFFRTQAWQVEGMALDITDNALCVAELDQVWDLKWSRNPLDPRNFLTAVPRIQEIVTQGNYDLVHVHTPVAAFVTRYAIHRLKIKHKPQIIYTAHGFHFHQLGNPLTNLIFLNLEKLAGKWTDYLITINREDETAAKKHHLLPSDRIFYTPGIGLDLREYDPNLVSTAQINAIRQEFSLTPDNILFLCIAEFTPNKRHQDQLIALKKLNQAKVHLLFAGDGQTLPKIQQLSIQLRVQQQVHFLGFRQDIPALIASSIAVLLTSQREGLPRSIMEAFCAGKPVIGTKIRGIQDLLSDDCGLLIDVGDTDALARAMREIIEHPEQTAQMSRKCIQKITSFDVEKIIELYNNVYNHALNQQ